MKINFPTVRLRHIASLRGGAGFPHQYQGETSGNIPFFKVKDLATGSNIKLGTTDNYVDETTARKLGAHIFPPGTIFMAKVGAALLLHRFVATSGPACIDNNMLGIMCYANKIDRRFLEYAISLLRFDDVVNPGAIPSIGAETVGNKEVPLPPLEMQNAIADFLDSTTAAIDGIIEQKQRMLELLVEQREALINQAVTKGLDLDVPMKDSGVPWIGEIPAHWDVLPLRWIVSVSSGSFLPNTSYVESCSGVNTIPVIGGNGELGWTNKTTIVDESVIVVGRVGALCGNVHLVCSPAWITDNALVIRAISHVTSEFLAATLRSRDLNVLSAQNAQPLLTGEKVKAEKVPCPPIKEQEQIDRYIIDSERVINKATYALKKQIIALQEYRQSLITAAVTGQLDVSKVAENATADFELDRIKQLADKELLEGAF